MAKYGLDPILDVPEFPYDPKKFEKLYAAGDEKTKQAMFLAIEWMKQINTGIFKTWDQLKLLRDNWDGPIILKGILSVKVSTCSPSLDHPVCRLAYRPFPRTRKWLLNTA